MDYVSIQLGRSAHPNWRSTHHFYSFFRGVGWNHQLLVMCYITIERSTLLLISKSIISTGPFSSSQTVNAYQRVSIFLMNMIKMVIFYGENSGIQTIYGENFWYANHLWGKTAGITRGLHPAIGHLLRGAPNVTLPRCVTFFRGFKWLISGLVNVKKKRWKITMFHWKINYFGKRWHNYWKSPCIFHGKINYFGWAIFNSKLLLYQRVNRKNLFRHVSTI